MDQNYVIDNLKSTASRNSALETLMDFERVLDNTGIYGYKNWMDGQIVEGPGIEKYWVTVTLMWPAKKMPDPEGAERLLRIGGKVYYAKDQFISAAKLRKPEDSEGPDGYDGKRPGQQRARKVVTDVWLVTIEIPRKHMQGIEDAKLRVDDQEINSASVDDAYNDSLADEDITNAK
tara:strand:+ start:1302 stop:1829 length:528 start_codon:yes stop_codon:yes gene_type:complete